MLSYWSKTVHGLETVRILNKTDSHLQYIHLTNIALGRNPANGPHTVLLSVHGLETAIATLQKDGCCFQHGLNIRLDTDTVITNTGESAVHLVGYTANPDAARGFVAPSNGPQVTKF